MFVALVAMAMATQFALAGHHLSPASLGSDDGAMDVPASTASAAAAAVSWPANDSRIEYEGRVARTPNGTAYDWTMVSIGAAFEGTGLAAVLDEKGNAYSVYVDNQLVTVLNWAVEPNIRAFFEADRWVKERKTRAVAPAS